MNTTTGAGAPRRNTCGGDDMLLGWPEDAAEPSARARSDRRRTALASVHPVEELARLVCRSRWEEISEQVLPEQYLPERIAGGDVQELLRRVDVRPDPDLSRRFPEQHSARARLRLRDGRVLEREQHDCEGFHTRPMSWDTVAAKFDRLASRHAGSPAAGGDRRRGQTPR